MKMKTETVKTQDKSDDSLWKKHPFPTLIGFLIGGGMLLLICGLGGNQLAEFLDYFGPRNSYVAFAVAIFATAIGMGPPIAGMIYTMNREMPNPETNHEEEDHVEVDLSDEIEDSFEVVLNDVTVSAQNAQEKSIAPKQLSFGTFNNSSSEKNRFFKPDFSEKKIAETDTQELIEEQDPSGREPLPAPHIVNKGSCIIL